MTPDLQRLCAAAQTASGRDDIELTPADCEAIVRAVLTALREPSEGMVEAADTQSDIRDDYIWRADWRDELAAAIDHILSP